MRLNIDITPHTSILQALRLGRRVDYKALVGEAVDNSLDASATRIEIGIDAQQVVIRDDGEGIRPDRLEALFTLGQHENLPGTQLGRFGIGIKMQTIATGDTLAVDTIARVDGISHRIQAMIDWERVQHSGRWSLRRSNIRPVALDTSTGTEIRVGRLRREITARVLAEVEQKIQKIFHPALISGRVIELNGRRIAPLADPRMRSVIELTLSLSGGCSAHVRAGLIVSAHSTLHHVHIGYGHRIIMDGVSLGCGEYSGLNKMFARVQLAGPWQLAQFKDELTNEDQRDELEASLYEVLLPLLEECQQAGELANTTEVLQLLNDMLAEEWQAARPRQNDADRGGAGADRSRQRGRVDSRQADDSGPATTRRPPRNRVKITFDGLDAEHGIGKVDRTAKLHRIDLAGDNPFIAATRARRTDPIALRALFVVALGLYEQARAEGELELDGSYGQRWAKLLALQRIELDETGS